MNSENPAFQVVRFQDAQVMFNQGQVGTPRDAAAIAEMQNLLSTIVWQVGDQRRTTEKHGGFNGRRGIDFAVEMQDITAF